MSPVTALTLCVLGAALIQCSVFVDQPSAGQILRSPSRRRRANSVLEEILPGDLERECYEESCSQEEAAEIFQTREKTLEFWFKYMNLNPCQRNPCLNGGVCTIERGDFLCLCPPQYQGKTCDTAVLECRYKNGGCVQYCKDLLGGAGVQCGCAEGYELESDGRRCTKTVSFPCGRQQRELLSRGRSLLSDLEPLNISSESWGPALNVSEPEDEVLIHRADGYGFCGGTLVSDRWVVSAAHCLEETADHVTIGDFDKWRPDPGEQLIKVQKVFVHPHFHSYTFDSDIALLYLARPVVRGPAAAPACLPDRHLSEYLLQDGYYGKVTGWGRTRFLGKSSRFLRQVTLPVVSYSDCRSSTKQFVTDNMFCAGYLDVGMDSCSGDSGGPFAVYYRGTWFLTGVVSWGEKCAAKGKYGVYTRLGNFLNWIRDTMERADVNVTES